MYNSIIYTIIIHALAAMGSRSLSFHNPSWLLVLLGSGLLGVPVTLALGKKLVDGGGDQSTQLEGVET